MTTSCTLNEFELLDGTTTQNLFIHLTPIIICVGLLGNILTICVFIITDLKRQSVSILTIALAIVDSFVLLIPVLLVWLENILQRELTDVSPFWCRTHGFFDLTFTCCSSWLMICIAFERFCAVWFPHRHKVLFTHRKIFFLVLGICFSATIISTWFIFVVKMILKTPPANIIHASTLSLQSPLKNTSENFILSPPQQIPFDNQSLISYYKCDVDNDNLYDSMGMVSVVLNYFLPFIFVLLLNSTIIYRLCNRGIVELTSSITVTLILVCLVHLFCTLPFQCWWIYYEVPDQTGDCLWLKNKLTWRTITFTIRNINYMANFFLYSCSSVLFRDELKGLILLCLLPHERYQSYRYRRQSLYDNMQQNVSLFRLIVRRLSRTSEYPNGGPIANYVGGAGAADDHVAHF
ncbi:unnamed protein product [Rotaria magnacalcarata]|uniref:G-protein coupled receptors family 1 profile domain-containing protein n=2 Tax=Rotaria magnacalcarata TaxID=392030 RepID=A0A816XPE4_9BILA|nr:unnamed protein product [Rotaria magnacalcarata]CAF1555926.1 unnamed protein product [Rotaria magnacalcarata]CAF2048144.1 unnamed protein product [Rotaria magnacalcarata]CAF2065360.1 unnamed protein product [Rotaria magnacalcarata]CAF2149411.1 unnamed protein product [Rotaria magnacalcarata]